MIELLSHLIKINVHNIYRIRSNIRATNYQSKSPR
jgi:hypothetical protein